MPARLLLCAWLASCSLPTATLIAQPAPAGGRTLVQPPPPNPATRPAGLLSFKSLTFTRAQPATEFAADGTIYTVGNDVLRRDPTGTFARLEKPHVQWALHNEDLTQAV
jgi:hypothetical protein